MLVRGDLLSHIGWVDHALSIYTLMPKQNRRHFADDISDAFSRMEMHEFRLRFHWTLFVRFELTIIQNWYRRWVGRDQVTSPYLNQWWSVYWRIYALLGLNGFNESGPPSISYSATKGVHNIVSKTNHDDVIKLKYSPNSPVPVTRNFDIFFLFVPE